MDFSSSTFPDFTFHLALFPLTGAHTTTEDVEHRRSKIAELMHTYPDHVTFINAKYVASLMHINIAVSRALLNKRDVQSSHQQMKTSSFPNEILYHLYPTHSVSLKSINVFL